jgi:peptidoglycan/LPS O-acetylase OafA/YrhL
MQRVSAGPVLLASLALSIGVGVLVTPSDAGLVQPVVAANWLPTLHFLFMFACGAALALRRTPVETWLNGPGRRAIVLTLSCSAYFEAMLITHRLGVGENVFFFDWLVTAGATGIIACALGRNAVSRVLDIAPLRFLGDISYSMYLFHFLLIDAVAHALGPYSTYPRTAAVSLVLVVPVSLLANRLFEKPAMRLAAHITKARIRRVANMEVIAEAVEAKNQQPLAR